MLRRGKHRLLRLALAQPATWGEQLRAHRSHLVVLDLLKRLAAALIRGAHHGLLLILLPLLICLIVITVAVIEVTTSQLLSLHPLNVGSVVLGVPAHVLRLGQLVW